MLNAMIWALACFGVVAADIALSIVLFSALGVASVFMGFSIDDLDIQLLQAVAQAASFCALVDRADEGVLGFFAGIDKAKFRNQVLPGDVLTLSARIVKSSSRMVVADVEARVGDKVCATATQKYVLARSEE